MQTAPSYFDRLVRRYGGRLRHRINAFVAHYSQIANTPTLDPAVFAWSQDLLNAFEPIRDEVLDLVSRTQNVPSLAHLAPDHEGINQDFGWKSFFLWGYGYRVDRNCARLPKTTEAVERIPGLLSALVSIHTPGTHLSRHRGVTKGMITLHLPLKVPSNPGACRIEVEDQMHIWREGELFIFDDTYEHETWNDTDEPRINLMLHVRRPLTGPGLWLQTAFFWAVRRSHFVQGARANIEHWAMR